MFEAYEPEHKHVREAPEYVIVFKTKERDIQLKEVMTLKAWHAKYDNPSID